MAELIEIEPDGEAQHGACPDCGEMTRSIWGYVANQDGARAIYYARWTDGHVERGAQVMVSIGLWGDGTVAAERMAVGLECRVVDGGPAFMVVDASTMPWANEELFGANRTREEVMSDSIRFEVFRILDRVVADDSRFRAFLGAPGPEGAAGR
jgi:hypothetical protein